MNEWIPDSGALSWVLFFLLICFSGIYFISLFALDDFMLIFCFYYYLLEFCSPLIKAIKDEDPEVKGHRKKLGGAEGQKPETGYIAWEKKLFSVKGENA